MRKVKTLNLKLLCVKITLFRIKIHLGGTQFFTLLVRMHLTMNVLCKNEVTL